MVIQHGSVQQAIFLKTNTNFVGDNNFPCFYVCSNVINDPLLRSLLLNYIRHVIGIIGNEHGHKKEKIIYHPT